MRLAEKGYRVGVPEAGRRFDDPGNPVPGDSATAPCPETSWRARRYLWAPRLGRPGSSGSDLLRGKRGSRVLVLAGAGVGGGSLVYANTLYVPPPAFFADPGRGATTSRSGAHFIGGCVIGDSADSGVIDGYHRVFGHEGLHIVDGSAVSANLGVNPALTITAQAERAMSMWPNRGQADPRPGPGEPYRLVAPVPPDNPAVPAGAPAALRLTSGLRRRQPGSGQRVPTARHR